MGIILLLLGFLPGCGDFDRLTPHAYLQWLQDPVNGLVQTQKVGSTVITVSYLPPELRAYNDMRGLKSGSTSAYDTLVRYHEQTYCFDIQMKDTGTTTQPIMDGTQSDGFDYCSALRNSVYAVDDTSGVTVSIVRSSGKTFPMLVTAERDLSSSSGCHVTVLFPAGDAPKSEGSPLDVRLTSIPTRGTVATFRFVPTALQPSIHLNPETAFVE